MQIFRGAQVKASRRGKALLLSAGLLLAGAASFAQVTGGQYSFEFLRLSNSPHVSALGGLSVANPSNDISLAVQNPALMRPGLHNQLQLNYNGLYAGISSSNLAYGYHSEKINTSFVFGLQYINYGNFQETNTVGNVTGEFKAIDYSTSLGASRSYGQHWRYGANLKYAHSALAYTRATAVMMDMGVNYFDTGSLWDIGIVAKNMGVMLDKYTPENPAEPIPFDLQLGASKQFKHLPLRLFTTAHHLYEWDIRYDNPDDVSSSNILGGIDSNAKVKNHTIDKFFRHFIFGGELTLGKRITVTGSYNVLRRKEMVLQSAAGVAGFAFGVGVNLNKFVVQYGRSYYHIAGAYNEIGLTLRLNKLGSLGSLGERIHWDAEYTDWE